MTFDLRKRLNGLLSLPDALGFGSFLAWQFGLIAVLFPVSNGLVLSPLVLQSFSCCLVFALAFLGLRRNRAGFSTPVLIKIVSFAVLAGTAGGTVVVLAPPSLHLAMFAAVCIGCSVAVHFYAWADILSVMDARRRIGTSLVGLACASVIEFAVGYAPSPLLLIISIALLGCGATVGFSRGALRSRGNIGPLMIRPAKSNRFYLVLIAVILFAFIFGSVSGTTAAMTDETTTRSFHRAASIASFLTALPFLIVTCIRPHPLDLSFIGRLLTPFLALLFLAHVIAQGSIGGLLPKVTLGFWQFMQVFVVLMLIGTADSGFASMSFTFPLGWGVVAFGFALGALFGQTVSTVYGPDESIVQSISAIHTIVAVVAASVLGAAKYPAHIETAPPASHFVKQADPIDSLGDSADAAPVAAVPADPLESVCESLASEYSLSSRELEVLDLLARGNTRAGIAERLFISENTVRVHVKNIYAKMNVHSKQQLIDLVDGRADAEL